MFVFSICIAWSCGASTASQQGGGCDGPGDFEVTLPWSQMSVQPRRRTKYTQGVPHSLCIGREKARQASVLIESEVQAVFRRWHHQAEEQRYSVQPHSPAWGIAPCPSGAGCPRRLVFYPGRSHSACALAKGQVLSVQLGEEQKGGDGVSRFEPGVHLSVFCRLLGWDVAEITGGYTPDS